jgi:hypothetical protein
VDLLYTHAAGLHFSAGLHGSYQSDYVRANLDVTFTLGINNGGITYSGRGSADCDVYESSLFGWHHVGDVAVWVSNHDLGFSVDGKSVDLHW